MTDIRQADGVNPPPDLAVREPQQRRTREQWARILDQGVRLLEDGGYEAFTIAALCERADVPPRALYARTASKDALFLAVYEHGMQRVLAGHNVFRDIDAWNIEDPAHRVELAVRSLVQIFVDNARFLRAVVLISAAHSEVQRRGEAYRHGLAGLFTSVVDPALTTRGGEGPAPAGEFCFSLVFSAMVVRTAYGPGFGLTGNDQDLANNMVTMAQRYLLGA